jgi:cytochrome c-type biogenesis protein CcmH
MSIVLALAAVLAALLLALPLLRTPKPARARGEHDLAVYRAQLAELAREHEVGRLGATEHEAARLEVQRRMLAAAPEAPAAPPAPPAARWAVAVSVLAVPALAAVLYLPRGNPDMPDFPLAQVAAQRAAETAEITRMLGMLRTRLATTAPGSPERLQGLVLLANTLRATGDLAGSVAPLREALAIRFDPEAAINLAEALTLGSEGRVPEEARALLARAVAVSPGDARGEFYLGLAERQAGETAAALSRWQRLAAATPPDAPWLPLLRQRIAEAEGAAGVAPGGVGPAPDDPAAAAIAALPADQQNAMIRGMVDRLRARLETTPADGEGWLRLARAERVLGNKGAALVALEKAEALLPGDARVVAERRALAEG